MVSGCSTNNKIRYLKKCPHHAGLIWLMGAGYKVERRLPNHLLDSDSFAGKMPKKRESR
jgi:hypothetical protein